MSEPKQSLGKVELPLNANDLSDLLQFSLQIESELEPIYHLYQEQSNQLRQAYDQPSPQIEKVHQSSSSVSTTPLKSSSTAFLWNREGFTPIPSVVDSNDPHTSASSKLNVQQSQESGTEPSPSVAPKTQDLVSEVFKQELTHSDTDQQPANMTEAIAQEVDLEVRTQADLIPSSITEKVEHFVPFVERLQQSQDTEEHNFEREEPDSSIPQSLDEIYSIDEEELISNVQGTAVAQALSINSKLDPELHVALAPASLRQYRRTPWQKIILVCLFCLLFGGLIAYLYLYELASFMK